MKPRHGNHIPHDGYNEDGYIDAVPRLFDVPLRFTFRPLLSEERAEHLDAIDKITSSAKREMACAAFIASRLCSWDHADDAGEPIAINAVNVGRLKPTLSNKLYRIVMGIEPSDLDPKWTDAAKAEEIDAEYQSAKFGQPVGDVKLVESAKN